MAVFDNRQLVISGITIEQISEIIANRFEIGEPVELQLINLIPTYYGAINYPRLPTEQKYIALLFGSVANKLNDKIERSYSNLQRWEQNIPYVSFEENSLIIRWRAKTSVEDFGAGLEKLLASKDVHSLGIIELNNPIADWLVDDIQIYKYNESGVGEVREIEEGKQSFFNNLLTGITENSTLGVPNTLWIIAGVIVIPQILLTIREFNPND